MGRKRAQFDAAGRLTDIVLQSCFGYCASRRRDYRMTTARACEQSLQQAAALRALAARA